ICTTPSGLPNPSHRLPRVSRKAGQPWAALQNAFSPLQDYISWLHDDWQLYGLPGLTSDAASASSVAGCGAVNECDDDFKTRSKIVWPATTEIRRADFE